MHTDTAGFGLQADPRFVTLSIYKCSLATHKKTSSITYYCAHVAGSYFGNVEIKEWCRRGATPTSISN